MDPTNLVLHMASPNRFSVVVEETIVTLRNQHHSLRAQHSHSVTLSLGWGTTDSLAGHSLDAGKVTVQVQTTNAYNCITGLSSLNHDITVCIFCTAVCIKYIFVYTESACIHCIPPALYPCILRCVEDE